MAEDRPGVLIEYDTLNYSESQIRDMVGELSKCFVVEKRIVFRESTAPPAFLLLALLSAPFVYFSRGFFNKMGDKLGDEVGNDLVEAYRQMKRGLAKIITKPASKDIPTIIFQIPLAPGQEALYDRGIKGAVKTNDEKVLSECFDRVEELHLLAKRTLEQLGGDKEVIEIKFQYNQETKAWEPRFCELEGHIQLAYKNGTWQPLQ